MAVNYQQHHLNHMSQFVYGGSAKPIRLIASGDQNHEAGRPHRRPAFFVSEAC
jgi:hypothetical protein